MSSLQQSPTTGDTAGASNVLDCDSILKLLQDLLPTQHAQITATATTTESSSSSAQAESQDEQEPKTTASTTILASAYEGLAALSHTIMTAVGFRLVGLGEDDSLEPERMSIEDLTRANVLPTRWNASTESYSFRYTHSHSQLTYLIKCMRIAGKFVIHGTAIETNKICSLEIEVKDFVSPSYFPWTTHTDLNRDPLWNAFISRSRIQDLIAQFRIKIVQTLIPGLNKPGYQEEGVSATSTTTSSTRTGESSSGSGSTGRGRGRGEGPGYYPDDPSGFPGVGGIPRPGRPGFIPRPPIFGDPFSAEDPGFMGMGGGVPHNPYEIGRSDLDPFGGRIGGIGGIGGGGIGGFGGGVGGGTGGGMIVGPNHPMFRRPPGGGGIGGGNSGIYGGPQPLPRGSVPPGARFDPIGPFGAGAGTGHGGNENVPGAGTAHPGPRPGQRPGASGVPFSGEPDNDEAPPPGYMDMFM
ncbi:hypothetical protein BG011_001989 [Mortierella polycephala]|uniref:Proteasome inhibitor PI31 subunit n=1 Tax=Mortierella polycephala TaxID=41804 RepID=A0A9P6U5D2_9FUNG|nr:hypothetical protein BG011_001989 [Mortierella polycephala]